eukprot:Nitzschia sp. Nitz4//scaffold232_size35869//7365//8570//NITZ4_007803-RA/size35869-processed-gene-0.57-mRNA-1//1//CDS//3329543318//4073//frame0
MDLLQTLNLEDLPEQQTRTIHLMEENPDFDLKLGFDACCACGKPNPKVTCEKCERVLYCSPECRGKDSEPPMMDDGEQGLGHSAVICALLALCNDDEATEGSQQGVVDEDRRTAALDRLASEYESYPATLANILHDGPCYQDALFKKRGSSLVVHIVGASTESELWKGHPDLTQQDNVFQCYAEALGEMSEQHKLKSICLYFVGPDCPSQDLTVEVPITTMSNAQGTGNNLMAKTISDDYNKKVIERHSIPAADIVVLFNPGFTCPDYSWDAALEAIPKGTPFLIATNTELEAMADIEHLMEVGFVTELPPGLAAMLQGEMSDGDDVPSDNDTFFSVNPFSGNRVRQSGTMANDLFVKNHWIFGGITGTKTRGAGLAEETPGKKQRTDGSGNSKKSNPALV